MDGKYTGMDTEFPGGGEALPYIGYIGMCRCEGYGFQAVHSGSSLFQAFR